jgi:hypothetical protein
VLTACVAYVLGWIASFVVAFIGGMIGLVAAVTGGFGDGGSLGAEPPRSIVVAAITLMVLAWAAGVLAQWWWLHVQRLGGAMTASVVAGLAGVVWSVISSLLDLPFLADQLVLAAVTITVMVRLVKRPA